jgi:hypothetical protein
MANKQTDQARADYWRARALSEQARGEEAEALVLCLRKQLEAAGTRARLVEHVAGLKASGIDLSVGEWQPDDARECFVRTDRPVAEPPAS